ncbi:hypothetical protein LCGC14_1671370, partial [marine sediment metagenome]
IASTRMNVLNVVFVWRAVSLMLLRWNNFVYRIWYIVYGEEKFLLPSMGRGKG